MKYSLALQVAYLLAGVDLLSPRLVVGEAWENEKYCENGQSKVIIDTDGPSTLTFDLNRQASCTFQIKKNPGICQIRLGFDFFRSTSANLSGICGEDRLTISNSVTVKDGFSTCGDLSGQHMFLTFDADRDTIDLNYRLSVIFPYRSFRILLTPIHCSSSESVPNHCLQSFNGTRGIVRSFDYPIRRQTGQEYTVCVEPEGGGKQIVWRPCGPRDGFQSNSPFSITSVPSQTCECDKVWVGVNGDAPRCDKFPEYVRSIWKPFLLNVNFNEEEIPPPEFPEENPGDDNDEGASCVAIGENSGGRLICEWYSDPNAVGGSGTCMCAPTNPWMFAPSQDVGNIGFCLKYDVQI